MIRARVSSFLVGAATGSAFYYAVDSSMLRSVSRADKRALEIREELVGMVSVPFSRMKHSALELVQSPLSAVKSSWNSGVKSLSSYFSSMLGEGK